MEVSEVVPEFDDDDALVKVPSVLFSVVEVPDFDSSNAECSVVFLVSVCEKSDCPLPAVLDVVLTSTSTKGLNLSNSLL